ncbi:CHASE domain-containing protein [Chitinibacter sp. SCUT-21]|uniref:CHASE domain-containing protein n=1 Tax=Chitinibacter sp. SCUT-21 TaxID=2970891 RepID=UPI0035A656EB
MTGNLEYKKDLVVEPHSASHLVSAQPTQKLGLQVAISLVLAYVLLGWLGLSLAIPPGFASPVFPAAGLALAACHYYGPRALPLIWLGSFFLNTAVSISHGTFSSLSIIVAAVIALGAILQAWLGQLLIHRRLGVGVEHFDQEKRVVLFLLNGGVVACFLAPSIGVGILSYVGIIPVANFAYSWWNWYVGDVLGVLIAAPVAVGLFQWRIPSWRKRLNIIAGPIVGMLVIAIVTFIAAAKWEQNYQRSKLDDQAQYIAQAIDHRFISHVELLESLARLIEVSPEISGLEFEHFTQTARLTEPDFFALSFNPYILQKDRFSFEQRMGQVYPEQKFEIKERNAQRQLVRAGARAAYVPIAYISPLAQNYPALGFDIYSEPTRRNAIQRAMTSRKVAATAPIKLVQDQQQRIGVLVMAPAFERRSRAYPLQGFAVGVIQIEQMIELALKNKVAPGLEIELLDLSAPPEARLLYRTNQTTSSPDLIWRQTLRLADRDWELKVLPTAAYLEQHRSWLAWTVGVFGLLFATMLQIILLGVTGRASLIERKVLEQTEEIRLAMRAAEAGNLAKSQFLATMSHEIRTPLNGILGMAQMLQMEQISEADRRDYAQTIVNSGQTLLTLLNDVLDFSKIEAGKLQLEKTTQDPARLLRDIAQLFAENATEKGLQLTAEWEGQAQFYLLDSNRIRQMLSNLVNNAIKFTPNGSVRLIGRELERQQGRATLEFSVIDTGLGLDSAQQAMLFQPFTQVDNSITRRFGGTGLGLSIVSNLAQLMGGRAGVESQPGQGARFWFCIQAELASENGQEKLNAIQTAPEQTLQGKILVVEDNPVNQKVVQALLAKLGLSCQLASNGQEGVEAVMRDPSIELVLMDVHMPLLDGREATKKIRTWEIQFKQKPRVIIALTADAFEADHQLCLEAGMNDFLTKPLNFETLKRALQQWLNSSQNQPNTI